MEADRYQKSHTLFIVGMFSLLMGLSFLALSLYMFPHLWFGWKYDLPWFIPVLREWLQNNYDYSLQYASRLIFFGFFLPGLVLLLIAYFSSNTIDNEIYGHEFDVPEVEEKPTKPKEVNHEGRRLGIQLLFILLAVFVGAAFFEWLIYTPSDQNQMQNISTPNLNMDNVDISD